jgi:hypothetical protein
LNVKSSTLQVEEKEKEEKKKVEGKGKRKSGDPIRHFCAIEI